MALGQYGDKIKKIVDNGSISFEISDSDLFYATGFKVIQNFPGGGMVRAMSSTLNGNMRLVYDISRLMPLSALMPKMDPEQFCNFTLGLIVLVESIKSNGFIFGENVFLEQDMVFLNPADNQVNLIYLPIKQSQSVTVQLNKQEKNTINLIRQLMKQYSSVQGEETKNLQDYLSEGGSSLSDLKEILMEIHFEENVLPDPVLSINQEKHEEIIPESLILERVGGNQGLILRISPPAAVIGRDPAVAQVLIPDSSISKKHCLICKESTGWKIEDLQSSNHTWIGESNSYLEPYQQYEIKPGDTITLARFVFQVKAGMGE